MNQFVIPDDGRRERTARQDQRGDFGATAIFVFSPDWKEVVTLYGSRFKNRKVPSGGIEERDFPSARSSIHVAARNGALRELKEETGIDEQQLSVVAKTEVEDVIRGNMMRYYHIAIAKTRFTITPFPSKEDGKDHHVEGQRWESVKNMLCVSSHEGETYNTLYSIALVRILQEMQEQGFSKDSDFREMLIDLAYAGINLDEQLVLLEERKAREETERRERRFHN
jgi:8-oxo-dGTP pyrophosphatase MutT (NUDIX family)